MMPMFSHKSGIGAARWDARCWPSKPLEIGGGITRAIWVAEITLKMLGTVVALFEDSIAVTFPRELVTFHEGKPALLPMSWATFQTPSPLPTSLARRKDVQTMEITGNRFARTQFKRSRRRRACTRAPSTSPRKCIRYSPGLYCLYRFYCRLPWTPRGLQYARGKWRFKLQVVYQVRWKCASIDFDFSAAISSLSLILDFFFITQVLLWSVFCILWTLESI